MNERYAVMTRHTFFEHSVNHHGHCLARQDAYLSLSVYIMWNIMVAIWHFEAAYTSVDLPQSSSLASSVGVIP